MKIGKINFVSILFFMSAGLMLLITVVVSIYINQMERTAEDAIQNHLIAAARAASTFLTVDELDLFHTGEDTEKPEWEATRERLKQFAKDYQVLFVYYWRLYGDGQIQYIIDNDEDEEEMVTPELTFDIDDDPATAEAVPFIMGGNAWASDLGVYTTSWDGLISGLAPVLNEDNSVYCAAGVDLSDEVIITQRNNIRTMRTVLIFSLFLSIFSGIMAMLSYRKKAQQSEHANKAKTQFLATMSHEIRTPLNAVIGLSEIELQGELSDKSRNNIQNIHMSGSSLLGIINDILDISKIEAGGFELIPVDYETTELIGDIININRIRIGSKPINFELEIEDYFPRKLFGDELRIKQILNNLLSNAIKYTNEGEIKLKIEGNKTGSNSLMIRFTVRDSGRGIRKEDIPKLFSGYTQFDIKRNRKIEGTGLGLEITKKLTEMMGGHITVESEYGKGSSFAVTFVQEIVDACCIGKETAEELRQLKHIEKVKEKTINRSWMPYGKVLVVDDISVNLHVANGLLEQYGLVIDTALSGKEAIEKIKSQKYDLVFMDHMMPEMDGIEAVRIIREWEEGEVRSEAVPIVALTANAMVGNIEMFQSNGFNGFIAKPIDAGELDKVLNRWVRDKQSQETLQQAATAMQQAATQQITMQQAEKEKPALRKQTNGMQIDGLDIQRGIAMTGGKKDFYIKALSMFCNDAETRIPLLAAPLPNIPDKDTIKNIITQVHALKSASGSMGAEKISQAAAEIELAGRNEDIAFIKEKLPVFAKDLAELTKNIYTALENEDLAADNSTVPIIPVSLFKELEAALKSQNIGIIDHILKDLEKQEINLKTRKALDKISDELLIGEFDNAKKIVDEILLQLPACE